MAVMTRAASPPRPARNQLRAACNCRAACWFAALLRARASSADATAALAAESSAPLPALLLRLALPASLRLAPLLAPPPGKLAGGKLAQAARAPSVRAATKCGQIE